MSDFLSVMEAHGLNPPKNIEPGRFFRFPGGSKNKGNTAGWCMLFSDGQGGVFGDFSRNLSETWQTNVGRKKNPAERAAFERQVAEVRKQAEFELQAKQKEAAKKATEILEAATGDPTTHPYVARKQVQIGKLGKRGRWQQRGWNDALLIPIYDSSGKIVTVQAINEDGTKDLLLGGKKKGCFYPIGKIRGVSTILIGEGLATVAAGCEATGFPGVVAIDAGNLVEVSKVVRGMAPKAEIILLADDDQGGDNNPGIDAATKAARTVNGKIAFPGMDKKADFWDLFNEKGQEWIISAIKAAKPVVIDWQEPILFDDLNTPEIPARLLPKEMANFTAALAEATETPEALAVMSVLGVISAVAAKRFVVCPIDGWLEPVNIYTAVTLPPGNNKSLVLNNALSPLVKWEREQAEILSPEIKHQWSERKSQEKLIESMRSKMAKERDSVKRKEMIEEIADLEAHLIEPEVLPQVFCNDSTPEALTTNVYEQGGRFALFSDEGGIIETMSGLYSGGHANVDVFLKGIDGGHVRVRRGNRSFDLNPFLTFVLCVQPVVLQNMASKKSFRGNGSLERFIYAIPKSNLGYRTHDKQPISETIRHAYHRRIGELLEIPCIKDSVGIEQPRKLTLALDAFKDWREFQAAIEVQLRPGGRLEFCQGWGGKISGYALRIAGLLHIAKYGQSNLVITGTTMANALELAALLTKHALAAFQLMGTDESTDDAKELYKWITANTKESYTQSDFSYAMRNRKQGKQDRLQKAVTLLIDRIILGKPETARAGNAKKPTTFYRVNPAILKGRI